LKQNWKGGRENKPLDAVMVPGVGNFTATGARGADCVRRDRRDGGKNETEREKEDDGLEEP
jgi:hypothetical protein